MLDKRIVHIEPVREETRKQAVGPIKGYRAFVLPVCVLESGADIPVMHVGFDTENEAIAFKRGYEAAYNHIQLGGA